VPLCRGHWLETHPLPTTSDKMGIDAARVVVLAKADVRAGEKQADHAHVMDFGSRIC
jgi:hypothetical protein